MATEPSTAVAGHTENTVPAKKQIDVTCPAGMGMYILKEIPAPHSGFAMDGLTADCKISITDDGI